MASLHSLLLHIAVEMVEWGGYDMDTDLPSNLGIIQNSSARLQLLAPARCLHLQSIGY